MTKRDKMIKEVEEQRLTFFDDDNLYNTRDYYTIKENNKFIDDRINFIRTHYDSQGRYLKPKENIQKKDRRMNRTKDKKKDFSKTKKRKLSKEEYKYKQRKRKKILEKHYKNDKLPF